MANEKNARHLPEHGPLDESGREILLSLRNIEIDKARSELELYAEKINEQVIEDGTPDDFQENLLRTVTNAVGIQGNILNADGDTIASTTELHAPYPEYTDQAIIAAMNGMTSFSTQKKSTDSFGLLKEWMSFAVPVRGEDNNISYIIYYNLSTIKNKRFIICVYRNTKCPIPFFRISFNVPFAFITHLPNKPIYSISISFK